ncbi:ABC transporter substrate-binding protein [Blastococcus sp. CT_GayMR16]|uniref:ABC transporter substrate-binding protein n=1 Tax=Blastococcus sp. CT_GayMR16 TaxID=2559607 RepID=UPI00107474BA|nr:ABC transporter substrate-binding protein [Blastococcus sp. CT_GayMR16]TFV85817.1 nitrate ABC transporter substrate-binding protein [Blastococcus sp. CT_GayMR16]
MTATRSRAAAAGVAALLALVACGGSDDAGGGESDGGLTPVTIGTQPIVDSAPLYLGVDQGFFEEEGIELTIESAAGGAAVVPSVVSGDFQFGRGNVLSTMIAVEAGLPLRCITNANSTAGDPDFGAVVVRGDSPIQSVAELPGNTVSVNTLNNIGDTTIRSVVEEAGGDPQGVEFVEIPFPDAPAALDGGQVDAAWILEPFLTEAVDAGARVLSYNFSEFHPELDISCVFASEQLLQEDPELVEAFTRAMNRSLEYSQENPDEVRRITGTYTEIEPAVLERIVIPTFRTEFSREALELLGAKAVEYGTLEEEPDLDRFLP